MAKHLTDMEWVSLAADAKSSRPSFEGVRREPGAIVATQGYRLHLVEGEHGLDQGLFHVKTGAPIDAQYPNWRQVVPVADDPARLPYIDIAEATPILKAAIAAWRAAGRQVHWITLPTIDGRAVALNPEYVFDALSGAVQSLRYVPFQARDPLSPVLFHVLGVIRQAVIMPMRRNVQAPSARFDLTEFIKAHDHGKYPFPAYSGESA
jgi:hypothetical protein